MEKQHREHHNGGFFLGVIVGAIITLLFTTKKGRRIVKNLSHEGLEKFGEWEGLVKDITDALDGDMTDGDDYSSGGRDTGREYREETEDDMREDSPTSRVKSSTRRFFRGVRKKA